jgi:type I restriction enzyme S subunit
MNAERLLAQYERVADAPDAVGRLRKFVLDLAVRGKLVAQGPTDEPAEELLKRIAVEKATLAKAGKLKKTHIEPVTRDADAPFELPASWAWACLGDVAQYGSSAKVDSNKDISDDTWVLDLEDIEKDTSRLIERVLSSARSFQSTKTVFKRGDVLFGKLRPYLNKTLVADQGGVCTSEIIPIRGYCRLAPEYVRLVLKSPLTMGRVDRLMYGMKMPRLGTGDAVTLSFPLPPIAEQHRIVAKVDELMALCDRLEAARAQREATRDRLATASLARLNAPAHDTFRDDARFAIDALPALTTRPDQIHQMRETLLTLAVGGKLVRQHLESEMIATDFDKEPAAEAFPPNWRMLNFGKFCDIQGGNQPPKSRFIHEPRDGYVQLLQIRDLGDRSVPTFIPTSSTNRFCKDGEILIGRYGASVGKIFWARDGAYNVALAKFIWPANAYHAKFAFLLLRSRFFQAALAKVTRSAQAGFNKADLAAINFPLPPLAEQHRIVAKVDELMAHCDRLEARLKAGDTTRRKLLDALLAEALAPASHELEVTS